jgi:hypothetical protein
MSVVLLFPFIQYHDVIDKFFQANTLTTTTLTGTSALTATAVIFVIAILVMDEPIRMCFWGARAFAQYDHRRSTIFAVLWICWRAIFQWTHLFGFTDDAVLWIAVVYLVLSFLKVL